jgi:tetraacyldisaccharide 4'-kinase
VVLLLPSDLEAPDPELLALSGTRRSSRPLEPAQPPPPGPQVAFAGIAKPWKVERALQAAGCDLRDFAGFPDHAAYDRRTLARAERSAEVFDAGLLTTEKDWVRSRPPGARASPPGLSARGLRTRPP